MKLGFQLLLLLVLTTVIGCGDPRFMDKTKIDGSILKGEPILPVENIYGRTVLIAKNFEYTPGIDPNTINMSKFGLCSGVVVTQRSIVTAAHCVKNYKLARVVLADDSNKPISLDQVYSIESVSIPFLYEKYITEEAEKELPKSPHNKSNRYDIAVINLSRDIDAPIDEKYFTSPASTLTPYESTISAYALGFGRTSDLVNFEKDESANALSLNGTVLKTKIEILPEQLNDKIITVDQRSTNGVCIGDSGGPLFINRDNQPYLQAIAINVYKVKADDVGNVYNQCYGSATYLNLDYFKNWIASQAKGLSHN